MTCELLLNRIFEEKIVYDEKGNKHDLQSNISKEEGIFLQSLIKKYQPENTIEIGCAQGISSLFICSELEKRQNTHHTIIDAFQSSYFNNIGVANLNKANVKLYDLKEEYSEIALPKLLSEGKKYDFCFIDGNHTFDHVLIDFFYLNRMTNIGGIIVLDDVGMPSINRLVRYLLNYPAYKLVDKLSQSESTKIKLFDIIIRGPFRLISKLMPKRFRNFIFTGRVIKSNKELKLNSSMVALQKIKEDERSWDWFVEF